MHWVIAVLTLLTVSVPMTAQNSEHNIEHLKDFQVVEFRRYTINDGGRRQFCTYFETYFPEAFEQLGAIALGHFFERDKPNMFLWLRGFHSMDDRARLNAAFYYGPLWKEHRATLNGLIADSDNVILMRPLRPLAILPAVDPVKEPDGAHGIGVALLFTVKPGAVDAFAQQVETAFARFRAAGIREAAVLVTLDATNNFPQLPVRTDGPYLVWLGMAPDDNAIAPVLSSHFAMDLLRAEPEVIVLDPGKRSRLRWLGE